MTTVSFSKQGQVWVATTDSLGNAIIQIKRSGSGKLIIERYIDGMVPVLFREISVDGDNIIIPLKIPVGMKIKLTSTVEVTKALMMNAVYEKSGGVIPDNVLTETDIVNTLSSDETNKPLSAAQGKALKTSIDNKVIPGAATTSQAGIVKKMTKIDALDSSEAEAMKAKINEIITGQQTALIMES